MLLHLIIFITLFVMLAATSTWVIFIRMVRENLRTGEVKNHQGQEDLGSGPVAQTRP